MWTSSATSPRHHGDKFQGHRHWRQDNRLIWFETFKKSKENIYIYSIFHCPFLFVFVFFKKIILFPPFKIKTEARNWSLTRVPPSATVTSYRAAGADAMTTTHSGVELFRKVNEIDNVHLSDSSMFNLSYAAIYKLRIFNIHLLNYIKII